MIIRNFLVSKHGQFPQMQSRLFLDCVYSYFSVSDCRRLRIICGILTHPDDLVFEAIMQFSEKTCLKVIKYDTLILVFNQILSSAKTNKSLKSSMLKVRGWTGLMYFACGTGASAHRCHRDVYR